MEELAYSCRSQGVTSEVLRLTSRPSNSCGPPVIGEVLADCCGELTARAKHEGYGMRFIMQIEVFN